MHSSILEGVVFSYSLALEKRMQGVLLDAFIQGLVYMLLTRFLQVQVLGRYFYNVYV